MIDSIICLEGMFYKTKSSLSKLKDRLDSAATVNLTRAVRSALYKLMLVLAVSNLLLCMFNLKTLISISFFILSLRQYIVFNVRQMLKNGLISYLPYNIQVILLRRSIFDFLCDMWFFPKLSLYAKAIFGPLIMKPDPENAARCLSILPEPSKKAFFTKGIIYVLPKSIKNAFLPKSATLYNKVYSALGEEEENHMANISQPESQDLIEIRETVQSDDESIETQRKRLRYQSSENNLETGERILDKSFDSDSHDSSPLKEPRSKVILSSKMMKQVKFIPGRVSDRWDNLELYHKLKKQATDKLARDPSFVSNNQMKNKNDGNHLSPISFVLQMIEVKKKKYLNAISYKKLAIVFSASAAIIVLNLVFSKTNRKITKKMIMFAFYATMMGVSASSLLAMAIKPRESVKNEDKDKSKTKAK